MQRTAKTKNGKRTMCSRGHLFFKSSATPVCPICWPGRGRQAVDAYIARYPKPVQAMLKTIRAAIRSAAPKALERISYGIPFYEYRSPGYKGRLVYFAGFAKHVSIYAWGREVDKHPELKKHKTSTGTLRFPLGTKIPVTLVKKVTKARMQEIDGALKRR